MRPCPFCGPIHPSLKRFETSGGLRTHTEPARQYGTAQPSYYARAALGTVFQEPNSLNSPGQRRGDFLRGKRRPKQGHPGDALARRVCREEVSPCATKGRGSWGNINLSGAASRDLPGRVRWGLCGFPGLPPRRARPGKPHGGQSHSLPGRRGSGSSVIQRSTIVDRWITEPKTYPRM